MAYDGFFINAHIKQLTEQLVGVRVEKIYQPNDFEIVILFRGKEKYMLSLNISSQNPRVCLLEDRPLMPETAPVFCMLLRKHLNSGVLQSITQYGYERIIFFEFQAKNELGDNVIKKLCIEIMGKHSNLMLLDENDRITEALKHVNASMSSREIYGSKQYSLPDVTKKMPNVTEGEFISDLQDYIAESANFKKRDLYKFFYVKYQGFSSDIAKSVCFHANYDPNSDNIDFNALYNSFTHHTGNLNTPFPLVYLNDIGDVINISAIPLHSSDVKLSIMSEEHSFDACVLRYFDESKNENNITIKLNDTLKLVSGLLKKAEQKKVNLEHDIELASNLESFKLYGELILANMHKVEKGSSEVNVLNYYDNSDITIELNPRLNANENSQSYYKKYNKAKSTIEIANEKLASVLDEIMYLETVIINLSGTKTQDEYDAIISELTGLSYIAPKKNKKKNVKEKPKSFTPHKYLSSDGFEIRVGKNNIQNDELTLKKSDKNHIWLHVKDMAGSHTVISATFEQVSEETIIEAAKIAAFHSKAKDSAQVPVDFTEIKNVHKPSGSKPGMVIYDHHKTVFVTPEQISLRVESN